MSKQVVGSMSEWSGMLMDFQRQIHDGSITRDQLNAFLERRNPFEIVAVLRESVIVEKGVTVKLNWKEVYEALGMLAEYHSEIATLAISEQEGLWTVPVIKEVTCDKVVAGLKSVGVKVYTYTNDLDKDVTVNDRDPNRDRSYTVSFHSNVEADEENKNQSADQRKEKGCKDITLLERLLLELAYFLATGNHLDEKNWTLCSGSRDSDGSVPSAYWSVDAFRVSWDHSGGRHGRLRARSVVSCQS